ncbi:NAD(P)/FAD-dependent oxidoreductase [Sandaracinus amylolyticus]|uniref:FAD-binding protein n=1 Tax=Sandaracinus amylolyticus TaxID=927083 RepID=A0A0F6YKC7_9BACT|nr:NAD(P)/FAD-dependent oxidoreductase [Sandaracinus amylolyticus]AKF07947.1 FAD-binding protein [Sandaracinus amylolyticus]
MATSVEMVDCVVLGGGPAGSTFAAIAKKYAPEARVLVLEKERFPRWRIGESTIPAANGVFKDLGVYETLLASPFVKKMGVTFVWGRDRQPWNADYLTLRTTTKHDGAEIIEVTGQDFEALLGDGNKRDTPYSAFNVERSKFDDILLRNAERFGAEVREGTRATAVTRVPGTSAHVIAWEDDQGARGTIRAGFVMDASGLSSLLTRGQRIHDDSLNNFAVYGYLRNAEWKVTYSGTKDRSTVFIAAVEKGWIWYFPLGEDLMTVGAVTNTRHFKDRLKDVDLETFFWEMLRSCPEVAGLVENATLRDDVLPGNARVGACRDWSSWAREPVGEGWAAAGDAAMFVDPILSTGVTLALQTGHRAAYTWLTARRRADLPASSLWRAYADYLRGEYGAFLRLARYFYGNNKAAPSWWWEAQQLVNASGRLSLSDRQAFTMATAGFFPVPRALGAAAEVVVPLLQGITGGGRGLERIYHVPGVPSHDVLPACALELVAPFRVDLRTEPNLERGVIGSLEVYHDLVTEEPDMTHRLAAVPARIDAALAPIAEVLQRCRTVSELLERAPSVMPAGTDPRVVRKAALDLVRIAALKGFVRVVEPRASVIEGGACG